MHVRTAPRDASAISATTAELSTPPDRNAPSGTSDTIRDVTASRSSAVSSSSSALADPVARFEKSTSHQRDGAGTGLPRSISKQCPAGSFLTPETRHASSGT